MKGGERHPTPEIALRRVLTKSDKRKTAKAVIPLRFKESLFLLYRDLTSTFEVQSPHVLIRIFLAGYSSIFGMVYVNRSRCLQAIKTPPNFKTKSESVQSMTKQLTETSFFLFGGLVLPMVIIKTELTNCDSHKFTGSKSNVSGFLMTVTCKFFASINVSCLHFGQ